MKRFIDITATTRWKHYNAFLHSLGQKRTVTGGKSGPDLVFPMSGEFLETAAPTF